MESLKGLSGRFNVITRVAHGGNHIIQPKKNKINCILDSNHKLSDGIDYFWILLSPNPYFNPFLFWFEILPTPPKTTLIKPKAQHHQKPSIIPPIAKSKNPFLTKVTKNNTSMGPWILYFDTLSDDVTNPVWVWSFSNRPKWTVSEIGPYNFD